jgi:hypothetical protein
MALPDYEAAEKSLSSNLSSTSIRAGVACDVHALKHLNRVNDAFAEMRGFSRSAVILVITLAIACSTGGGGVRPDVDCALDGWTTVRIHEDGQFTGAVASIGRDGLPFLVTFGGSSMTGVHCTDPGCRTVETRPLPHAVRGAVDILMDRALPPLIGLAQPHADALALIRCSDDACSSFTSATLPAFRYDSWSVLRHADDLVVVASTRADACERRRLELLRCQGDECSRPSVTVLAGAFARGAFRAAARADNLSVIYSASDGKVREYRCDGRACSTREEATSDAAPLTPALPWLLERDGAARLSRCCDSLPRLRGTTYSVEVGADGLPVFASEAADPDGLLITRCLTASCAETSSAVVRGMEDFR